MRTPKFITTLKQMPHARRAGLAALLLAAFAVAVVAGSALAANLVSNGSFENDSDMDGIPNKWFPGGLTPADKRVCNQSYAGVCSFRLVGDGGDKTINQVPLPSGNSGDTYTLTFWVKGKEIDNSSPHVYVALYFHHLDGTFDSTFEFVADGTTGWTKHTMSLTATADFDYIIVLISMDQDNGKAWFDKVKLVGP